MAIGSTARVAGVVASLGLSCGEFVDEKRRSPHGTKSPAKARKRRSLCLLQFLAQDDGFRDFLEALLPLAAFLLKDQVGTRAIDTQGALQDFLGPLHQRSGFNPVR